MRLGWHTQRGDWDTNVKITGLKFLAAAAVLACMTGAAGAVTPLIYDQNFGPATDPSTSFNVVSNFPSIVTTGRYEAFLIFDVTGPSPTFTAVLSELDQGTRSTASYFTPGPTSNPTSYIELFKCTFATCGSIPTSSAFLSTNPVPTGTAITGTKDGLTGEIPTGIGSGWNQGAGSSADNLLAPGWYFYELVGTVGQPDHTAMQIYGGVALSGAVPEASTWAMLGVGFAGIGLLGASRRRKAPRYAL